MALGPRALKERRLYGRRARELGNLWRQRLFGLKGARRRLRLPAGTR
jgi:hypothetical protein